MGFLGNSVVKNEPNAGDAGSVPGWPPIPVFFPGKSHGQRRLTLLWGRKIVRDNLVTKQQCLYINIPLDIPMHQGKLVNVNVNAFTD